jgi:hypothetical protein
VADRPSSGAADVRTDVSRPGARKFLAFGVDQRIAHYLNAAPSGHRNLTCWRNVAHLTRGLTYGLGQVRSTLWHA